MANTKGSTRSPFTSKKKQVSTSKLKIHDENQIIESDEFKDLIPSIREYGLTNRIITNEEYEIISGVDRYLACSEIGLENVPVEIRNYDSYAHEQLDIQMQNQRRTDSCYRIALKCKGWKDYFKTKQGKKDLNQKKKECKQMDRKFILRDYIAEMTGICSSNVRIALLALKKIESLRASQNSAQAELLISVMHNENFHQVDLLLKQIDNETESKKQEEEADIEFGTRKKNAEKVNTVEVDDSVDNMDKIEESEPVIHFDGKNQDLSLATRSTATLPVKTKFLAVAAWLKTRIVRYSLWFVKSFKRVQSYFSGIQN